MASGDLSRINTNIQAMNALNALNNVNSRMSVHQLRLATGKRINSASDDAAGFTIASKLKVKSEGLGTALDNIGSAKNLMTVAEGHMNNIKDILTEMKSKAQQAANGTIGDDERAAILSELQEFNNQIDAEVAQAKWAGVDILGQDKTFQIGVGTATADELTVNIAESVWGDGTATTFNSAGLDVVASSSINATVSDSILATLNIDTASVGATTAMDHATGLEAGHYNIEASYTANGTISVNVFDSDGAKVTLDADGDSSTDATAATLSFATSEGDLGSVDLGVGITLDLGTIDTAGAGSILLSVDYSKENTVSNITNAQSFMDKVDTAIDKVTEGLSYVGAMVNRMSYQEDSLSVAKSNTEAAHSRIVDADMAWEQLEATKLMILQQTATSMLAQANTAPQSVLSLFG
jgi:flagellin